MLSEFKKYTNYFLFLFVVSAGLTILFRNNYAASGICLGVALCSSISLFYIWLESFVLMIKKAKEDKNLWYTETLIADNNAVFVFGKDPRSEANEIVKAIGIIYDHGIHRLDLTMFGKTTTCIFSGNNFLCPFETSISNTLCISGGKFYRMNDTNYRTIEEFEEISFLFLSELHRALKEYVEQLYQPS